jgi:hypothetical protein
MKKLTTIRLAVVLLLSLTCVSWATLTVNAPPGAPSWWDTASTQYAYASWDSTTSSPPNDSTQWASNFLANTSFTGGLQWNDPWVNLSLGYYGSPYSVYIYLSAWCDGGGNAPTLVSFNIGGATFTGTQTGYATIVPNGPDEQDEEEWNYVVSGTVVPPGQMSRILQMMVAPDCSAFNAVSMWAGVSSVPEPATIALLGLGGLAVMRKRRLVN